MKHYLYVVALKTKERVLTFLGRKGVNLTVANLISASPHLYSALVAFAEELEVINAETVPGDLFLDKIRDARTAMDKARGAA
jgi:hypothetical protein